MILYAEYRQSIMLEAFNRIIVDIHMGYCYTVLDIRAHPGINSIIVVLRCYITASRIKVLDRVVTAMMAKF